MIGVIEGFTIIFTVILAGYLLARFRIIANDEQRLVLNRVAFYTATPALVFTVVSTSEPTALFSPVVVVSTIAALLTAAVFVLLSRVWFPLDRETTVMGATASSYINSNNIGLPVGMFVLGSAVWAVPILIVQTAIFAPIIFALISNSRRLLCSATGPPSWTRSQPTARSFRPLSFAPTWWKIGSTRRGSRCLVRN